MEKLICHHRMGSLITTLRQLEIKNDLLSDMQYEAPDILKGNRLEKIPIGVLEDLKKNIIVYYSKQITKLDPREIGHYYSIINSLGNKKSKKLIYFFRSAFRDIPVETLARKFMRLIIEELESESAIEQTKTAEKILIKAIIKYKSDSDSIELFWKVLNAVARDYLKSHPDRNDFIQEELDRITKQIY